MHVPGELKPKGLPRPIPTGRTSGNARPQSGLLFVGRFDFQGERVNGSLAIFVFSSSPVGHPPTNKVG
jgi:hypothetical protein